MQQITHILLTRHGETEWNLAHRMQGHLDSPLTPNGILQAKSLAKRLINYQFSAIYSSDLERAYRTSQYITALKNQQIILTDTRLRERNLGIFQGLYKQELNVKFPEEFRCYLTNDPVYVIPEGESRKQFFDRCVLCFKALAQKHPGETIVVVSHGGVLANMFKYILNIPLDAPRKFAIPNTSLNLLSCTEDNWRLESWGDISHLDGFSNSIQELPFRGV